jgi:hypothetical protein
MTTMKTMIFIKKFKCNVMYIYIYINITTLHCCIVFNFIPIYYLSDIN